MVRASSLAWNRVFNRLGTAELLAGLRGLGGERAPVLLVHSSLSALGHLADGPTTAIDAFGRWANGRPLVLPTHTYCYPDADRPAPVFDVAATPSRVGRISDAFWKRPGVHRSRHPSHSLAAIGPDASAFVDGHERCGTPCGVGTPYERLVQVDAGVLLFGATLEAYTLFHTAEDAAGVPSLYYPEPVTMRFLASDGSVQSSPMLRQDMRIERRFRERDAWLEERGLLRRGRLGRGELLFVPSARAAHEALVEALRADPGFLSKGSRS